MRNLLRQRRKQQEQATEAVSRLKKGQRPKRGIMDGSSAHVPMVKRNRNEQVRRLPVLLRRYRDGRLKATHHGCNLSSIPLLCFDKHSEKNEPSEALADHFDQRT